MTVVEATRESFRDLVAEGVALVDLWGPDCASCLALMPEVARLAEAHGVDVVKLEAPKARRLCIELRVLGLPAFLLFRDGQEVARLAGPAVTAAELSSWLAASLAAAPGPGGGGPTIAGAKEEV